jgi:hypothetical protein
MAKKGKKPRRTMKQLLWKKHFLDPESEGYFNKTKASELAGYETTNKTSLSVIGCENFNKLRDEIAEHFKKNGLSDEDFELKLIEGMNAKSVKTKFDTDTGRWQYSEALIDWGARYRYLELMARVTGKLKVGIETESIDNLVRAIADARERAKGSGSSTES